MSTVEANAAAREQSFIDFSYDFFGLKFPDGNVPVVIADFFGMSSTILTWTTRIAGGMASYSSGESFKAAFMPLQQALAAIGLVSNVSADVLRLSDAIDHGNQANIDQAANTLFSGIAGALLLGLGAMALGVPAIGLMGLGYVAGRMLYGHADLIADLLRPLVENLPDMPDWLGGGISQFGELLSPLANIIRDPMILDLDGDGIELTKLQGSSVHFDYNGDGFSERTGWVSSDDGILVRDLNGDGVVNGAGEIFGSASQDGFAILETMDSNGDGKIDAQDERFSQLRVWRDLNQNGISDLGEMQSLQEIGIQSISTVRTSVQGTNQGHSIGYGAEYVKSDQSKGTVQTIYFEVDLQDTVTDNTPAFTPGDGVLGLPQLGGSGQIPSIAWKLTFDASFKEAWLNLTGSASMVSADSLRDTFETLMLRWAGVEAIDITSRGQFVDARHLAFVEKFFGSNYQEIYAGNQLSTSPTNTQFGYGIEQSFEQIVSVLLVSFLSQVDLSTAVRGLNIDTLQVRPYFALVLLRVGLDESETLSDRVSAVVNTIISNAPTVLGEAATYLIKAFSALNGVVPSGYQNNRNEYVANLSLFISKIEDEDLRQMVRSIVDGSAALGTMAGDGLIKSIGDDVFVGGGGNDILVSGEGSDIFVYSGGDGSDYIRDTSISLGENDRLLFTDKSASDLTFERAGNNLRIKIAGSTDVIISEDFFREWGKENRGIDSIVLSDGSVLSREDIRSKTTTISNQSTEINDTALNDIIHGSSDHEQINISGGDDTILYSVGDGFDVVNDKSGNVAERDKLVLGDLKPSEVEFTRSGNALIIKILSSGEYLTDQSFFSNSTDASTAGGWGIDLIQFANGVTWNRDAIKAAAVVRGGEFANSLPAYNTSDRYDAGKGNDQISGGAGSDTYVWRKGDGSDTIIDNDNNAASSDRLILEDVGPGDVRFTRSGAHLLITIRSTGEVITISDQFSNIGNIVEDWNDTKYGIEAIQFSSGVVWGRQKIMSAISNLGLDVTNKFYVDPKTGIKYPYFEDELGHTGTGYDRELGSPGPTAIGVFDTILGTSGADQIDGSIAASSLDGSPGGNYFDGRGGDDVIAGGIGSDGLRGGDGNDILYGDFLNFDHENYGHDSLEGNKGNDILHGGAGNDYLSGGEGADSLYGDAGSDYLLDDVGASDGISADDYFDGGQGDDTIVSGAGSDTFVYRRNDGNDVISDGSGSTTDLDKLVLQDIRSDEVELTRAGNDLIIMIRSTNKMIVDAGFFWGSGAAGQGLEQIIFDDGTIWDRGYIREHLVFRGTDSREVLQSNDANSNTFISQKGDDIIISASIRGAANVGGMNGNDRFIYSRGDGNDLIFDGSHSRAETDTLILTDIKSTEVAGYRSGLDFVLKDLATGSILINEGFFWNWETTGQGIDVIQFADGISWDRTQMRDNAWYRGSVTNDLLQGSEGNNNVFFGDLGDDIIVSATTRGGANGGGANGNDLFIYNLGDGNDLIFDGSHSNVETDRLQLNGINVSDVLLSINGFDLIIKITTSGQQIIDEGAFWYRSSNGQGLDEILFHDGTLWNREDIRYWAQEGSIFYGGNSSSERLIGSHFDQDLSGNNGNDYIDGKGGSDSIHGDQGNDTLAISVANMGDLDQLDGGAGSDTVTFTEFGGSVFVDLVLNNGEARTSDSSTAAAASDRLIATIVNTENIIGTAFSDVVLADAGNNTLDGGAGDDILDGRSGNDILLGGAGNDVLDGYIGDDQLDGGSGTDTLRGGLGNDIYVYRAGDGLDVIFEGVAEGTADVLKLYGIAPSAVSLVRDGNNLKLQFAGLPGDQLTLVNSADTPLEFDQYGIEKIQFEDGTIWDAAVLRQKSVYAGATDGNDILTGTAASGDFGGGKGDDVLDAGAGNDNYIYHRGDGYDCIIENANSGVADRMTLVDINPDDVLLHRVGNDLYIDIKESFAGAGDGGLILLRETLGSVSQQGVEQIMFTGGTIWSRTEILANISSESWLPPVTIPGTSANDVLTGTSDNDVFEGGADNDRFEGKEGTDVYIYRPGDGDDIVFDYRGVRDNRLAFGPGIVTSDVVFSRVSSDSNDMKLTFHSMTGSVTFDNQLWGDAGIEFIQFADGTVWDEAEISRRYVSDQQTDANDTIWGTNLSDNAVGGSGDDTILTFNGNDRLVGGAGNDRLEGGQGTDVYVYAAGDGDDIIFDYTGSRDNVLEFGEGIAAADIVFSRVTGDFNDVRLSFRSMSGSLVLDSQLWGDAGVEFIRFADGAVWTDAQIAIRYVAGQATAGDDTIWGTYGVDTIVGGAGNDRLEGSEGSDTYIYNIGDGDDVILDYRGVRTNTLQFGEGITATDLVFSRVTEDANDFRISFRSFAGFIVLDNQQWGDAGVEAVRFADGTVWNEAQIAARYVFDQQSSANDIIWGTNQSDSIAAGLGDDILEGNGGNDTYVYVRGNGNDTINEKSGGGSADVLNFGDISSTSVTMTRNGNDVLLLISETAPGAGDGASIKLTASIETSSDQGIEKILFADGTTWNKSDFVGRVSYVGGTTGNDTIVGTAVADLIRAGVGDDTLRGLQDNDNYVYKIGDGNDIVDEVTSGSDIDVLTLSDLKLNDIRYERPYGAINDVVIRVLATEETITLKNQLNLAGGVETIVFGDGTSIGGTVGALDALLKSQSSIYGTDGNETITGSSEGETFVAGRGDDRINSGAGSDLVLYAMGDGNDYLDDESGSTVDVDTLKFSDLNAKDVTVSRSGVHVKVLVNETGHVITLDEQFYSATANWGFERIEFADGTVWDRAAIQSAAWIRGTSGNDTIAGTANNDVMYGGTGNDRINNGAGSDTYVYAKGDGNDYINDESGSTSEVDTLRLTDLTADDVFLTRSGVHAILTVKETGEAITFDEQFYSSTANWGIDKIEFSDGVSWGRAEMESAAWIRGTGGNDTIAGTTGNDTIDGGLGNDTLSGLAGNDTFVFRGNFGNDTIADFTAGAGSMDVVAFDNDVFADFASVMASATQVGADTIIAFDSDHSVKLKSVQMSSLHQDDFRFISAA
ncbi:calcium-binding protein [Rhizobium sp. SYY.PMSO]|uniref:calcium-binding protein n=1 Tax=Rhizobium sp. SYY.PMSO TaxID=3382192 RepID=UPI00398FE8F4